MCPNETIVLVILVPIFAPIITGIAVATDNALVAVKPTTIEVVIDEL